MLQVTPLRPLWLGKKMTHRGSHSTSAHTTRWRQGGLIYTYHFTNIHLYFRPSHLIPYTLCTMLIKASHIIENTDDFMLKIIVQKQIVIIISVLISLRFILQHDKKICSFLYVFFAVFVMRIRIFLLHKEVNSTKCSRTIYNFEVTPALQRNILFHCLTISYKGPHVS